MTTDWRPDLEALWDHYGRRIIGGRGAWQKAECPLLSHEDRNPSASVNVETGKWTCFSCDGRGDGIDIVKENEGLAGFTDALAFAQEHFAGSGGEVRGQRGRGSGVSGRPPTRKKPRNWSPPWSLS